MSVPSERPDDQSSNDVRLFRAANFADGEKTSGMDRKAALADGALWSGVVRIEPGAASAWHHHGDHATSLYVAEGQLRVDFGVDGRSAVVGDVGDFILVPKNIVHRESNPGAQTATTVVTRTGTGPSTTHVETAMHARAYDLSHAAAEDYEPFVVDGTAIGEVHWLRTEGSDGSHLAVGLWRCEPTGPFPYPFATDETVHALQGVLEIRLAEGEIISLRPGDIASFRKGTVSTWTVKQSFKKLFVTSG